MQEFDGIKDKIGILDSLLGSTTQNLYHIGTQNLVQTINTIKQTYEILRQHAYAGLYSQSQSYQKLLSLMEIGFDLDSGAMYLDANKLANHITHHLPLTSQDNFVAVMEFLGQLKHSSQNTQMTIKNLDKIIGQIAVVADNLPTEFNEWLKQVNPSLLSKLGSHIGTQQSEYIRDKSIVLAGEGNDNITGTKDQDILFGGHGNDNLTASDGTDYLDGGMGNDHLNAGNGDDVLIGGVGNDHLNGGYGADTYIFSKGHGQDVIVDYQWLKKDEINPQDAIEFTNIKSTEVSVSLENGNIALSGYHDGDKLTLQSFFGGANYHIERFKFTDKTVDLSELLIRNAIHATDGNDHLEGGTGNNYLNGGAGDDVFMTGLSQDVIIGGLGADTIKFIPDFEGLILEGNVPILKIQDFNVAQGDKLDFSSLFENTQINQSNIFEHLSLEHKNNHVVLRLDKDGAGDEHTSQNFIDLGYQPNIKNLEQLLGNMVI